MANARDISSRIVAALGAAEPELDTSPGTVIRKIVDVVAEAIGETQIDNYLISYQYDIDSRSGADLDAFVALFGFYRIPAKTGVGTILLQRSTPAQSSILVPAGSQAATSGLQPTLVRTTVPAIFEKGAVSVEVAAAAQLGGSAGNIPAGAINRWLATVEGISSVTNPAPFTGGDDMESDEELRERFKRTAFRNLAGTRDMYVAMGLADESVSSAVVHGSSAHNTEQIEVVGGTAVSSITSYSGATQTYPIVSATNASPVVITTRIPHNLNNGDYISITSVGGNTNVNGFRRVLAVTGERTLTVSDVFTDLPVAGNANHTANTGVITPIKRFGGMVDRRAAFGTDIDLGEVFPDTMYTVNRTVAPPTVSVIDSVTIPDGVYDLSFHYVSQASRNRSFTNTNRIVDRIDTWVDGERTVNASLTSVIDTSLVITTGSGQFSYGSMRRSDWRRPQVGNVVVPLAYSPVVALPNSFYIGSDLLEEGTDYWLLHNEVVHQRGSMEFVDAIEIASTAIETDVVNIVSSTNANPIVLTTASHSFKIGQRVRVSGHAANTNANGDWYISAVSGTTITLQGSSGNGVGGATGTVRLFHPLGIEYTYNTVPLSVQRQTEEWRMATSDLLVHKARELPLKIHLAVILRSGFTIDGVQTAVENSISALLTNIGIGGILQVSDIINAVTNVAGIDAARMLASNDLPSFNISGATNATPIVLTVPAGHGFQMGDLVYVSGVGGNTAANGFWEVETAGATNVQLKNSAGNGSYVAASGKIVGTNFAIQVMSPDGTRARSFEGNVSVTPHRASDVFANDNEHFVLHSVELSVKAQNSFGSY